MKLFNWIKDFLFMYISITRLKPNINRDNKFGYKDIKTGKEYTNLDNIYDIVTIRSGYSRDKDRKYYKIWLEMVCWNIIHEFKIESNSIVLESSSRYNTKSGYEYITKEVDKIMMNMYENAIKKSK